jgi:hypothetical protein
VTHGDVLARRLTFQARAIDDSGQLATSEIDWAIVDREQFLGRCRLDRSDHLAQPVGRPFWAS